MRQKEESPFWEKNANWQPGKFFVRKGEVGGFKTELPDELLAIFNERSKESLAHFNYLDAFLPEKLDK
jgi:hypothetical protein